MPKQALKVAPKTKKPIGKTAAHHKLIKRLFNGLPVLDAKKEITIRAIAADIKSAKRSDPFNCVFAKACQRIFGSHTVAFFRNFAYVEKNNNIERFSLPKATRDSVMMFDKAGIAEPGGYLLKPPTPSATLEAKLEQGRHRQNRRNWPGHTKKRSAKDVDFRSGTGLVQFLRVEKPWIGKP